MLPIELLALIVDFCDKPMLHRLLFVDSVFYTISSRRLYKVIKLNSWSHGIGHPTVVMTLAEHQELAALVQVLTIHMLLFYRDQHSYPSGVFLDLFLRALRNMLNLKHVSMSNHGSYSVEEQYLDQIAAAIQSTSIMTFLIEMDIPKSILKQIVRYESLTELGLISERIDENLLIEMLQDKTVFPNLKYLQALPDTLVLFAKYRTVKKMTVNLPLGHYSGDGICAREVVKVVSKKCPEILEIRWFFINLLEWLQVLEGLAIHGSTLKSHAVGLLLEDIDDESDEIWDQIGSLLKRLSGLRHLDLWAQTTSDFEETCLMWQKLETTCVASCPHLLSLWTPDRYLERSSATDTWPTKPRSFERCHSCVAAEAEVHTMSQECTCEHYMEFPEVPF